MKKTVFAVTMLLAAALVFVSCATAPPETPAPAAQLSGAGKKYALVSKSMGNPYNEKQDEGFVEAIEEIGGEAIVRAPEQPTAEGQIQIIDELIAEGVDSICIQANDYDALEPACKRAMDAGIKVLCVDSATNPQSRMVFVNQMDVPDVCQALCDAIHDLTGGEGEWAILCATSQASSSNPWISEMLEIMSENPGKYGKLQQAKVAYGDDLRDKSISEVEAMLDQYPGLKCIVAPTTVGIAAAGKVLAERGLIGQVKLTGLGLPSEMAEYIDNGACPYMFCWNPVDAGYLAGYASAALVSGEITGTAGEAFTAGRLGRREVINDYRYNDVGEWAPYGTEIKLGPPFRFDESNIDEWKDVY